MEPPLRILVLPKYYTSLNVKMKINYHHFIHQNCFGKMMVNSIKPFFFLMLISIRIHRVTYELKTSYYCNFLYIHIVYVLKCELPVLFLWLPNFPLPFGSSRMGSVSPHEHPPSQTCVLATPGSPPATLDILNCGIFGPLSPILLLHSFTLDKALSDQMPKIKAQLFLFIM